MRNPFLLDTFEEGGMGVPASAMPLYGLLTDIPWTIVGGIWGGYIIKWRGLRKTFIPLALFMSLPNLFYAWLAWQRPEGAINLFGENLNIAMLIGSSFESLGYGLSFSAIFYYMHITATMAGRNKTSILAISLCIMNLGFSIPMMASGYVQAEIGYVNTFILSSVIGLLAIVIIPFLYIPESV
jgi:PAT family beta-lactamase induction signal transducer AmpG